MYKLNRVAIKGGGDCAEMGITAVVQALKIIKPNSYVYVFTDASAKDTYLVDEALELIQRKQSQVIDKQTNCVQFIFSNQTPIRFMDTYVL
jgi:hemicentin